MASSKSKAPAAENQPVVTLEEALALAQGHHRAGNHILAERTYKDILRAVPDHFPTTQFLGVLLLQAGNFDEARKYLEIAVNTTPSDKNSWNNYGGALAQMNDYEGAMKAYDKALAIDPYYLDALNNKTYILWQTGRLREAEETARFALKNNADNLVTLNNLGIVLSKRSRYEESLDIWEKASVLKPDEAMVWSNWGNSLREMGRLAESEVKCRKAVELSPKNPEALSNLANALRDLGKLDESIDLYRRATNEKPDFYQAHVNLAIALADNHQFEESVIAGRYAAAFKNDLPEAYNVLSKSYCEMGNYDQAHRAAQRSIHLNPNAVIPYIDLAEVLVRLDRYDDAEAALQEALKNEPDSARSYMKLAEVRDYMNSFIVAHEAIDTAIRMSPDMPAVWVRKGLIYYTEGQVEKGLEMMEKALILSPNWAVALQHKSEMLISLNRNEEAEETLRRIIATSPHLPSPYIPLSHLKKFKSEEDPDFKRMLELEPKAGSYGQYMAIGFYYALSDAYEQMKNYDKAFEYLKRANDMKSKTVSVKAWRENDFNTMMKQQYTPEFIKKSAAKACDSDLPVFIIGMPRSGTTLTEQIIAAHPQAYGAGELPDLGKINKLWASGQISDPKALGEEYIRLLRAKDKTGKALRITDKMPANYMYVGLILSILPNAKIIHCRRNPIDTCLSCYKQNFARGQYWSYDLEEMADAYINYLELMDYWREILPGRFIEVEYEDTVNNLEAQARKIIDYVGLEWNDACLEPHKAERPVLTASKGQVTKPVYKTSVEKWRIYEKQLQPLVRKLKPELALPE